MGINAITLGALGGVFPGLEVALGFFFDECMHGRTVVESYN